MLPTAVPVPESGEMVHTRRSRRNWTPSDKALENIAEYSVVPTNLDRDVKAGMDGGEEMSETLANFYSRKRSVLGHNPTGYGGRTHLSRDVCERDVDPSQPAAKFSTVESIPEATPQKPMEILPPKTLWEAKMCPWWSDYRKAMQIEYDGHLKAGTWEEVPLASLPKSRNILRSKWVFDDKRDERGRMLKFKARLVAMGCTQREGEDFKETFAGVVVAKSFRIMLAILALSPSHNMEHWDIRMAFTTAPLSDENFMHPPECFDAKKGVVLRLRKSLYGLRQAARNFTCFLRESFVNSSFLSLPADPCVYLSRINEGGWCLACTHVDDIFCLFNTEGRKCRDKLFAEICSRVEMENLGAVSWALKTHILRDRAAGIVKISQEAYTLGLLKKKGLEPSPSGQNSVVPTFDREVLTKKEEDKYQLREVSEYQSDIGSLWWLAQISRPDIFYAVHRAAKMVQSPSKLLTARLQQIFLYLSHTPKLGLVYTVPTFAESKLSLGPLSGYADAAFATEGESLSRVAYVFSFFGNTVSWSSENPKRVMTSSTEAECRALYHICKENAWHRQLQVELGLYELSSTIVYEDNTSSIALAKAEGTPHKKSKHYGVEWAYVKECVQQKEVDLVHVPTTHQAADILTKHLPAKQFKFLREIMMGADDLQDHWSLAMVKTV